jgi:RNA polymerase sigma-70 factor, ECF subfamily
MNEIKYNYDEIYKTYFRKIKNYISRTAGVEESEDITQEVFIKVYKSLKDFKGNSNVYTWIYRIATNLIIDKMKKKKIVDRCNINDIILFGKANPEYLTEEFRIARDEMKECVCSYIKTLKSKYHLIIVLREYESLSIDEIAHVMEITSENAKRTFSRAKKKLKELLIKQCTFYYNEKSQLSCEKNIQ